MKEMMNDFKKFTLLFGVLFVALSFTGCSDDDDGIVEPDPTGFFEVDEVQTMTGNTLTLETITVGQDSWLVAVMPGDENTDNLVSEPVMLMDGTNTDVELTLDDNVVPADGSQEIVLKLYADDPNEGTQGEFDEADKEITDESGLLLIQDILVFGEDTNESAFASFDENNDGFLDTAEVANTYVNDFDAWDVDDDGFLSSDEFYDTTFSLTDENNDDFINEDEWNLGFDSLFNGWVEDDFDTFDADNDGRLNDSEWDDAFADSDLFETFDADDDGDLADTEWDTGLFNTWDVDDDDMIEFDEFDSYYDYVTIW